MFFTEKLLFLRKKKLEAIKKKKAQHWSWTPSCRFDIKGKMENKKRFASMKSVSINLVSPAGYCVLWFDFDLINSTQLLCTWRKQRKKWGRWMVVGVRTPSSKRAKECQKQQKENRHTGTRYSDQLKKKKIYKSLKRSVNILAGNHFLSLEYSWWISVRLVCWSVVFLLLNPSALGSNCKICNIKEMKTLGRTELTCRS